MGATSVGAVLVRTSQAIAPAVMTALDKNHIAFRQNGRTTFHDFR